MNIDYSVLNSAQRAAMEDTEGAVLVLAGAGSGKTRVLTYRVAYLVDAMQVSPYHILAITFTNKATGEMRARLDTLLGERNTVWISTFHSFCCSVLRRDGEKLGFEKNFSIYDESDTARTIKKALKEKNLGGTAVAEGIRDHISKAKNKGLSPAAYYADIRGLVNHDKEIYEVFTRYEELLKLSNAMDFDDLLYKTKALFEASPETLAHYQNRFRYIHVDEFQDTNGVQFELVRMLAAKWGNLFAVGDDDQSIYGWRGAEVENILGFERHFPGAKIHKLLQNYRSTTAILTAANNVIRHNKARHGKELFTERGAGARVEYFAAYNDYQEADWVIDQIVSLKRFYGYSNSDFAILVRANSLTRIFEKKLSSTRLKYQMMGGFRFFERKEIQDVIAYMRAVSNMRDSEAIERIINFPRRGIGDTTVERLSEHSRRNMQDLIEVILTVSQNGVLKGAAQKSVEEFRAVMADLFTQKQKLPLKDYVAYLVRRVGFEYAYLSTGKEDDAVRWENIQEFVRHVEEYAAENPEAGLDEFLQTVALQPERKTETYDAAVAVATMHAVKGLEFKVVFIVGCEEDVFPSARAKSAGEIEEERRVMYVAVTRAEERLYISCAQSRFRFNRVQPSLQSRFVREAKGEEPMNAYDEYEKKRQYIEGRGIYGKFKDEREIVSAPKPAGAAAAPVQTKPQYTVHNTSTDGFVQGAVVVHPSFGEGKIVVVIGTGADATATVLFPRFGVKKFKLRVAPLKLA